MANSKKIQKERRGELYLQSANQQTIQTVASPDGSTIQVPPLEISAKPTDATHQRIGTDNQQSYIGYQSLV